MNDLHTTGKPCCITETHVPGNTGTYGREICSESVLIWLGKI